VSGLEHPETLKSRSNLASALGGQGKHAEAEKELRATLAVQERVLGSKQPHVFTTWYNIAYALASQSKLKEALEFAQRADEGLRSIAGVGHPILKRAQALRELIESKLKEKEAGN
jgi:tetratricopeptide (TPR) repeat protein